MIRVTFNATIFALAASVLHFSKKNYPDKTGYTVLSAFTLIFSIFVAPLLICVIGNFKVQTNAFNWCKQKGCMLHKWCFNLQKDGMMIRVVHWEITLFSIGFLTFSLYFLVIGHPTEEDLLKLLISAFVLEFANFTFWITAFFGNNESEQRIENRNTRASEKAKTEI